MKLVLYIDLLNLFHCKFEVLVNFSVMLSILLSLVVFIRSFILNGENLIKLTA